MCISADLQAWDANTDATADFQTHFGTSARVLGAIDQIAGLVIEHIETVGQGHQLPGFDQAGQTREVVTKNCGTQIRRDRRSHLDVHRRRRVDRSDGLIETPAGGEALDLKANQIKLIAACRFSAQQEIDQSFGGVRKIEKGEGDFGLAQIGRAVVVGVESHPTAIAHGAAEGVDGILQNTLW